MIARQMTKILIDVSNTVKIQRNIVENNDVNIEKCNLVLEI